MATYRINLISDTVTQPTPQMRAAMMDARLGDDVFGDDPTAIDLEMKMANLFAKQAGLFCASGTMANQIAIKAHTQPLDEVLCEYNSHIYQYEVGGYAFHSGIAIQPIPGIQGKLDKNLIIDHIRPYFDWYPNTKLVVLENSSNRTGGNCYHFDEMRSISQICKAHGLSLHLDGARIFNAILAKSYSSYQLGPLFNSISVCLSKGLGCPVGTVLLGDLDFIKKARKIRKAMGGGMRQIGFLAAAGIYALDHHIERLEEDHRHAKIIAECLAKRPYVMSIKPVETNIIIFDLIPEISTEKFIAELNKNEIHASAFGKNAIRFVTHLDITSQMVDEVCSILENKMKF